MQLNDTVLKKYCENVCYKTITAMSQEALIKEFLLYSNLNNEFASNSSAYDLANSLRSFDFWFSKRNVEPKHFPIKNGSVFYIDLGAFNLKYETGYIHSCIVLKQLGKMLIVAPGSTKKYGKGNYLIEDVIAGDGFASNTGVLIDQIRCVSITRVKGKKIGEVSSPTLRRIEEKVFNAILSDLYKDFTKEITDLKSSVTTNEKQINYLNSELESKKSEIEGLNKKIYELLKLVE